ncbi:MAG: cell envelope integrity protein TolA [Thermodesulfovibrionales bacterium]|nr:cell envelope integrity protein TolA [Thermodesulfovibrionales bacterium]
MSFEKATGLSFAAHIVFLIFAMIVVGTNHVRDVDIYTVRIVSPAPLAPPAPAPATKTATQEAEPANRQKVPPAKKAPPKDSQWLSDEPAPVRVDKKSLALKRAALAEARHQQELRKLRDARQLKEQAIRDIEQKARLDSIRQRAASTGAEEPGGRSEAQRNRALAEYGERIQAIIYDNWAYTQAEENKDLKTSISVQVSRDGVMTVRKVEEPSGDRVFDRSALKAIRKTSKVEPPPFGKDEELILNFYPER